MKKLFVFFFIILFGKVTADTIELKTGEILNGKVSSYTLQNTILRTKYGDVIIPNTTISSIKIDLNNEIATSIPKNGLMAEYLFNNDVLDSSGKKNNGRNRGAISVSDRFEKPNSAYQFDGSSAFIEIPFSDSLNLENEYSISIWVKPDKYSISGSIIAKNEPSNDQYFLFYESAGNVMFEQNNRDSWKRTTKKLDGNEWNHVVVVANNGKIFIYINGEIDYASPYNTMATQKNYSNILIGSSGRSTSDGKYFKGLLDDIRIYNRGLSREEIIALYKENI